MFYGQVEGTDIVVLDKRFKPLFAGHIRVERLWTGAVWSEGPAWFAAGPLSRLVGHPQQPHAALRPSRPAKSRSFAQPSNNSNGNTVDNQGRLVTCEHLTRRVTRTEIDGSISVIADKWQGKRLNSPNDVVVKSDDSIWFTDPAYGIDSDNEGERAPQEIDGCNVYRVDPKTGEVARVIDDMVRPNGLAFSPDEKLIYVADTGATHSRTGLAASAASRSPQDGRSLKGDGIFRRIAPPDCSTAFASTAQGRVWASTERGRPLLRSRRDADRQDPDPGNRRQRDLRRRQAQSPLSSAARPRSMRSC